MHAGSFGPNSITSVAVLATGHPEANRVISRATRPGFCSDTSDTDYMVSRIQIRIHVLRMANVGQVDTTPLLLNLRSIARFTKRLHEAVELPVLFSKNAVLFGKQFVQTHAQVVGENSAVFIGAVKTEPNGVCGEQKPAVVFHGGSFTRVVG